MKNKEKQKTALLLHGLASSSNCWELLKTDLENHGYRVITPDLPGHGLSLKDKELYDLNVLEEKILQNVDTVDLLVGHSLGGLLATKIRPQLKPQHTILIDPMLYIPPGFATILVRKFFSWVMRLQHFSWNQNFKDNIQNWDVRSACLLQPYTRLPSLGEDVLVVRPWNSFVSPTWVFKKTPNTKVVTVPFATHNLHLTHHKFLLETIRSFVSGDLNTDSTAIG